MPPPSRSFAALLDEATAVPLTGWDFSFLHDRATSDPLPWDYLRQAADLVASARRVLDVDTGGGEVLASLRPPRGSVAVEPYHPNVAVAAARLEPWGVRVVERTTGRLPVDDESFDLVLNRHGLFDAEEASRVLAPGGRLLSQQVGARNDVELNDALGIAPGDDAGAPSSVEQLQHDLTRAGLTDVDVREAVVVTRYRDVGAVVFQLRAVPWQAPGFDPVRHRGELRRLHDEIGRTGGFDVCSRRFLVRARKVAD